MVHLLHFGEWQAWQNVRMWRVIIQVYVINWKAQNFGLNDTTEQIFIQQSQSQDTIKMI